MSDTILELLDTSFYKISKSKMHQFAAFTINKAYRNDEWNLSIDSLKMLFGGASFLKRVTGVFGNDKFSAHGLLPYNLDEMLGKLTRAFVARDKSAILRLSAEIGHYIADAHVPLHTTKNYNGQLTNQDGIHAFWESRIPELKAEDYDYFVGRAKMIDSPIKSAWKVVYDSHMAVDSVLKFEALLNKQFPTDQKYAYENRGNVSRQVTDDISKWIFEKSR